MGEVIRFTPRSKGSRLVHGRFGAKTGEIVRFVPKSERERARLIQEARTMYDSIFPSIDPVSTRQDTDPRGQMTSANANRGDGVVLS